MLKTLRALCDVACFFFAILVCLCWVAAREDATYSGILLEWPEEITQAALNMNRDQVLLVQRFGTGDDERVEILSKMHAKELAIWSALHQPPGDNPACDPTATLWAVYTDLYTEMILTIQVDGENIPCYWGHGIPSDMQILAGKVNVAIRRMYYNRFADSLGASALLLVLRMASLLNICFWFFRCLLLQDHLLSRHAKDPQNHTDSVQTTTF